MGDFPIESTHYFDNDYDSEDSLDSDIYGGRSSPDSVEVFASSHGLDEGTL